MAESLMVSQATQDTVNNKQNSSDNALNTTAKTVIGAINEHESDIDTLNSKLPWVKINTQQGTNDTNLPTTAREYLFVLSFGTSSARQALSFSFICPNDNSITGFTFSDGYYINSSSYCFAQIYVNCSTHQAHINSLNVSGAEYNSTSYLDVYAR